MYFHVYSSFLRTLSGAIITIDPNYEAAIEFVTLILAAIVIIVAAGKLNYALPAGVFSIGVWYLTEDTSWAAIAFLVVAIYSIFRRPH